MQAATKGEAARRLNEKGMQVLSLTELKKGKEAKPGAAKPAVAAEKKAVTAPAENRLPAKQLIQFTEEMSDLLSAGVQLDSALHSIGKRSESPAIRRVAIASYEKVRDGVPLASALRASSPSFSDLYLNLVSAGEVSGALGDILKRQVVYLTTLAELRGKLATAMVYPVFLILSGVGVLFMFTFFLIPRLRGLLEIAGGELPPIAAFLVAAGEFLKTQWVPLLIVFAILLLLGVLVFQKEAAKRFWDEKKLRLPLFGKLLVTRFNVQFVETLSNLLSNGMPLVKALKLVEGTTGNRYLRGQISEITARVSEGALLNRCLEKAGIFEPLLIDMVRIGEDTGHLAASISKAGVRLDREFGRSIDRIAAFIQPAIILVMAALVGVMSYTMISVIYDTISALKK